MLSLFQMRFLVTAMVMASICVAYITRFNLNIALVSMVDHTQVHQLYSSSSVCPISETERRKDELIQIFPSPNASKLVERPSKQLLTNKSYRWDQSMQVCSQIRVLITVCHAIFSQGIILGAFFYPYILFQMPAGMLIEKFGGRWILIMCLIGSTLLSILTPFITDWIWALIIVRGVLGAFQSGILPAGYGILCKWMPLNERSTGFGLLFVGMKIGASLPYFLSGYLVNRYGWPSLFYVPGMFAAIVFMLVFLIVRSRPEDDPIISQKELKFITEKKRKESLFRPPDLETPWRAILLNSAVLSTGFFQLGNFWILTLFYALLPKYLNEILHLDINTNGLINGFVSLLSLLSLTTTGTLSEIIIQKDLLNRTNTRKCFSIISGFATGICIMIVPLAGCHRITIIASLFMGSFFSGFTSGSTTPLPSEMSINFPVTLFSLLNMIQACTGFLTPAFASILLHFLPNSWIAWTIVWYFSGGLMIVANAFFLYYGSAERQPFDVDVKCKNKSTGRVKAVKENGKLEEIEIPQISISTIPPAVISDWDPTHRGSSAISHVSDDVFQ